jgi:hypothetical protein
MDKLFLAVMVSCILVLIAAAGLSMTLRKETTAVQKTTFEMIRQQRHWESEREAVAFSLRKILVSFSRATWTFKPTCEFMPKTCSNMPRLVFVY